MKKILKAILILIVIVALGVIAWISCAPLAKSIGQKQNEELAEVSVVSPTITFIGDSLTNGYYSDEGLQVDNYGYRQIVTAKTGATSYNFAVGGYTSEDVENQFATNVTLGETNQVILEKNSDKPELTSLYGDTTNSLTITEAIANSDYVISTIGANDVMGELLTYNDDGSFAVKTDGFFEGLTTIEERKLNIYSQINQINPDAKIIDIGMYMAYPHISDSFTVALYPVLMFAETKIFIEDPDLNTTKVTVRDNLQADIKTYINNPTDIHPNQQGYEIIANEVLKELEELENS